MLNYGSVGSYLRSTELLRLVLKLQLEALRTLPSIEAQLHGSLCSLADAYLLHRASWDLQGGKWWRNLKKKRKEKKKGGYVVWEGFRS